MVPSCKDRNVPLEHALRNLGLQGLHLHLRTGIDVQCGTDTAPLGVVVQFFKLHPRRQAVLLRVFLEHALHTVAGARIGNVLPPVQNRETPAGSVKDCVLRQFGFALNQRLLVFRPLVSADSKREEDLLGRAATLHCWRHLGLV